MGSAVHGNDVKRRQLMSTVTGQIEAISTKYGKFSIMVNDNWYGTKQEWAPNPLPDRGDVVEFDDGGKNFLKKLRIKSSGGGSSASSSAAPAGGKRFSTLGVELGHAANLAMDVTLAQVSPEKEEDFWKAFDRNTDIAFKLMQRKREVYEADQNDKPAEEAKIKAVEDRLNGTVKSDESDIF
jgi:hypothetical protein